MQIETTQSEMKEEMKEAGEDVSISALFFATSVYGR